MTALSAQRSRAQRFRRARTKLELWRFSSGRQKLENDPQGKALRVPPGASGEGNSLSFGRRLCWIRDLTSPGRRGQPGRSALSGLTPAISHSALSGH
jgi:hypothetical protein